jgi:hypothetical protein
VLMWGIMWKGMGNDEVFLGKSLFSFGIKPLPHVFSSFLPPSPCFHHSFPHHHPYVSLSLPFPVYSPRLLISCFPSLFLSSRSHVSFLFVFSSYFPVLCFLPSPMFIHPFPSSLSMFTLSSLCLSFPLSFHLFPSCLCFLLSLDLSVLASIRSSVCLYPFPLVLFLLLVCSLYIWEKKPLAWARAE